MKLLIKRVLKEYVEEIVQELEFDGFSEPILIPQFNKYLVKFNGTGKIEKIPDSEVIVFKDKTTGKEYQFDSSDVQKTGSSPFYIGLDVLRRYYDIRFDDEFVRHKVVLPRQEYETKLRDIRKTYISDGKCKNSKCDKLRDTIEESLKEMYGENYGKYESSFCEPTEGFLNVFPLSGSEDNLGNKWSKLNYVIFEERATISLIMSYLKEFGTFEHEDFIKWVKDNKDRLFAGPFLELMLRSIRYPRDSRSMTNEKLMFTINKLFPNAKPIQKFCPSTRTEYNELVIIDNDGEKITFQPVAAKSTKVLKKDGKYYIFFSRRFGAPNVSRYADYIVVPNGPVFKNYQIVVGTRVWEFKNPPVYYNESYAKEIKKYSKLK
jgi:hypothetical protein